MICDRFIAGHQDSDLRRHLYSVPPVTPIRDIVDRCRVWESHTDKTGTGEDPVSIYSERTGGHASRPGSCGGCYTFGGFS